MKKTGAWLVRYALEQIGVSHTFGIPGVHNTELYDEIGKSTQITPILVTHEGGGAFMAEAISRTSDTIGTLLIVPAAGASHAASGIGEAYLAGIPLLVIAGGVRSDSQFGYQLHEMDQLAMVAPICKKTYRITQHEDIIPTIFDAYHTANEGEAGPVFVEIPVNIQLDRGKITTLPEYQPTQRQTAIDQDAVQQAVALLAKAQKPALFLGWGARHAWQETIHLAEQLSAPVATSLQGLSVFPANHALHTGMGMGVAAVPAATNAFQDCDCLLAIGVRFGEIATGSFGINPPNNLIHIDINPNVFNVNYPAKVAIEGDAKAVASELIRQLSECNITPKDSAALKRQIAADKAAYQQAWLAHHTPHKVNPAQFFQSLRQMLPEDAYIVTDDGNHTFLTAELMPIYRSGHFISPTDYNSMGYCVPAAIGVKLKNRDQPVVGIVGDGALLMTGMEMLTAVKQGLGVIFVVFADGELAQISQAQQLPYARKTCTQLPVFKAEGLAMATGASYILLDDNADIETALQQALDLSAKNRPVLLEVAIDYSKKTRFTQGIIKTNLSRFGKDTRWRFIGRAIKRKLFG